MGPFGALAGVLAFWPTTVPAQPAANLVDTVASMPVEPLLDVATLGCRSSVTARPRPITTTGSGLEDADRVRCQRIGAPCNQADELAAGKDAHDQCCSSGTVGHNFWSWVMSSPTAKKP